MSEVKTEEKVEVKAADLLDNGHPAHDHFIQWCGDNPPTKRKARAFLKEFPKYRG